MKPEIKNIISPDIFDFDKFYPEDPTSFAFLLELIIGLPKKAGGDLFQIEVCTPKWLLDNNIDNISIFGKNKLIVFAYDIKSIIRQITDYCDTCEANSWQEIAQKISRIAHWEFEDYKN